MNFENHNYIRMAIAYGVFAGMSFMGGNVLKGSGVLIWSDEFDEPGLPNPEKWLYDVGGSGWGNNEAQYYTESRLENARVEDGHLIIEARNDGWPLISRQKTHAYTSARLVSKGRGDFLYGRIEVRAKVPSGRGTWPAIWMLPTGNAYGIWPRSGEIDIMEHVGYDMGTIHGSLHSLNHNWTTGSQPTGTVSVPDAHTAFHTYAVEWSPSGVTFLLDGSPYYSATNPQTVWQDWPFDQPFHLLLNVAVGGFWGGQQGIDPDIWPQRMTIDYVRVYDLGDSVTVDSDDDGEPNTTDTDDDGDGLSDVDEHNIGTNLLNPDSDGDGFSDGEEVDAETNPLLSSSYPGADPSLLLVNAAFEAGSAPWIIHTNLLTAEGNWQGQMGSWSGAYLVSDFVNAAADEPVIFSHYTAGDAPQAEHLLYQEWNSAVAEIAPGDTIRFTGTARLNSNDGQLRSTAFIRVLDFEYLPRADSAEYVLSGEDNTFYLETTIQEPTFNVIQVGFLTKGAQSTEATVAFSDIVATINASLDGTWASWDVVNHWVQTNHWLGYLNVEKAPWIWSASLNSWLYAEESYVAQSGGWVYAPK